MTAEPSHPTSQNDYDKLANLALFCCHDPSKPPAQWIYAVDDAWLHYGTDSLKSLYAMSDRHVGCDKVRPASPNEVKALFLNSGTTTTHCEFTNRTDADHESGPLGSSLAPGEVSASLSAHPDQSPAETLLEFISKHSEQNYGICFCTFEYFWKHANEINQSHNAVFFDIRHQLMEGDILADLKPKWEERLGKTGIFTTPDVQSLGIQIYFAFRLGLHPDVPDCRILPNHLLILSSNLFGNEDANGEPSQSGNRSGNRAPVLKSFSEIQKTIWDAAARANSGNGGQQAQASSPVTKLLDCVPTQFTFFPIPKHKQGGLFETALEIFHNSFRKAADFDSKMDALWHDMEVSWKEFDWGHFHFIGGNYQHKTANLRSCSWLKGDDEEKQASLRGTYLALWREEKASAISVRAFAEFLKWHCESDSVQFTDLTESDGTITRISLPTCPGVLFALYMAHFLRSLAALKENQQREKPEVLWSQDDGVVAMSISLGANGGVDEFKRKFFSPDHQGNSKAALNDLVNAQLAGLSHSHREKKPIGDLPGNGMTLREKLLSQTGVRRCKTLPAFENGAIKFSFYVPAS